MTRKEIRFELDKNVRSLTHAYNMRLIDHRLKAAKEAKKKK